MLSLLTIVTLTLSLFSLVPTTSASGDSYPTFQYNFDYLFTITYAFGTASPIVRTGGLAENINTFVGATLDGPAFNGHISRGLITNNFVPYGDKVIVFEEATWYGYFDNGDKGNGTLIARSSGLVDYDAYEQQRLVLTVDQGDHDYLQYIYILCGSVDFNLRTATAKQDCFRTYYGNKVALPPIFG
ncbi:uncharacterized protein I303_106955 [Kwoniella dejecticola CBS 10117]|uniref:DM13 domain-containing protein n=1 Tax=Kwoniella dejecticola CBS 10117 TaxID=1296121 RepID=A0A1A5ZYB4_9TREE|nr:uncharacterized protein I303_06356 [Kwoniella dejecticola CBS 10117]OBR82799.1 hypothetical protein I303_06356 [Kwoniella dejecticola CBS 10117]